MPDEVVQDLASFKLPPGFRGKGGLIVLIWQLVQATLFAWSPQPAYFWRRMLLRCFGAKIGRNVILRPTVRVTYPWKIVVGDYSWIGDNVELYSLGPIHIGSNTVVSQKCYVCAASHDYTAVDFPIFAKPVVIGDQVWLATDVFVGPGVNIGEGAVIGARSSIFKSVPKRAVMMGSPGKQVGVRASIPLRNSGKL